MVQLADLLATGALHLRLVGGDPAVTVRWVATSELDDPTPFLEGGELLLTTGLRTPRAGWSGWVDRLVAAGAAGVGFGVGLSHAHVPRTLVAAAAAADLALVEVPVATPFIAVSRRLADLLRRHEHDAEAAAARVGRDLTAAAAGPDGPAAVLRRTARAVGGTAWLLDDTGAVRAASAPAAPPVAALDGLRRVRAQGARAAWTEVSATGSLVLRAAGGSRWLLVAGAPDLPRAARSSIGTAAALLGLLTTRPEGGAQVRACVVDLVVTGRPDVAVRLAAATGTAVPDPVVVVRWAGVPPPGLLVGDRYALAPPGVDTAGWPGRAGVGRPGPLAGADPSEADRAFARTSADRPVVHADARSLPALLDPGALAGWARQRLAGLDEHGLRPTLAAFLAHHGARQQVADALGVHRNTVRQRLRHVEEVLGVRLDDPTDRAELWLALTATGGSTGTGAAG
ncbi:helix-turn-helix domain-containing protein [Kineococcus sp. SYSU DK001]|uniref:helix-turn-helix domain-containing protein n=1 Tax=Kineococcus sp. SYSU DK001 TaxID=3383122 RepID=UPI003D7CFFDA